MVYRPLNVAGPPRLANFTVYRYPTAHIDSAAKKTFQHLFGDAMAMASVTDAQWQKLLAPKLTSGPLANFLDDDD